jgi:xanthine/uracil/vitamin C permease (AzgA family)
MSRDWRISTFNGVLLASYFIPSWTMSAMKIWVSPIRGLYDRSNIGPAMYVSDYLSLSALGTIRFAWMLALGKVMVAAFFMIFLLLIIREAIRKKGSCDEALAFALGLGAFISMASLIAASKVGEQAALHMHASEALVLIGAVILLVIDGETKVSTSAAEINSGVPQQVYLSSSPSS